MSETPAAAPAAPAAPTPAAPAAPASLLDAAPAAPTTPAAPAAAPEQAKWFYGDGVPGKGDAPEWYKKDKYSSVEEQAKAYIGAEKLLGGFTGAPKDGYKFSVPEGYELDPGYKLEEDPMFKGFSEWASGVNMSQEGFDKIIGLWAEHNALPDPEVQIAAQKKALGEKADERITAISQWATANLDKAGLDKLRLATSGENAAAALEVIEAMIAKTRQPAMPKVGDDVPTGSAASGEAKLKALLEEKDAKGVVKYFEDPQHRLKVDALRRELYGAPKAA